MKRILVLYVLAAALIVALAIPASAVYPEQWWNSNKGAVELFRVEAKGGGGGAVPTAPAYVDYVLNCKATVTVEILPSDSAGNRLTWQASTAYALLAWVEPTVANGHKYKCTTAGTSASTQPTWPTNPGEAVVDGTVTWTEDGAVPVRTDVLTDQLKGKHTHLWACVNDAGAMVPVGHYVAKLSASSSPTQWDANLGLYMNWQRPVPTKEYVYRNTTGTTWQASTPYALLAWVVPTTANGRRYRCTAGGTTGATEPTWPTNPGETVADGTVNWTEDTVTLPIDTVGRTEGTVSGFYGIGVNNNVASPYYGRIYVPHNSNREISMYDVDGTFLGRMNDHDIIWFASAPWDVVVASDDLVFVSDRSAIKLYIFKPDGSDWISESTVTTTNDRAIDVVKVGAVHHVLITSGLEVYDVKATVAYDTAGNPTGATWTPRVWLYNGAAIDGGGYGAFGMCANSDLTVIYQASLGAPTTGVRKWENIGGTWTMNPTWKAKFYPAAWGTNWANYPAWQPLTTYKINDFVNKTAPNGRRYRCTTAGTSAATEPSATNIPANPWPTGAHPTPGPLGHQTVTDGTVVWTAEGTMDDIQCSDVEIGHDGTYLWVTAFRGGSTWEPSLYKIAVSDGALIATYDIINFGFMLARDAVGGIAMTFGKGTTTWPGEWWGMFAAPGTYTATKTTGAFAVPADPSPVLVPGSEQWTYAAGGKLKPDGLTTATVSFQVIDANGYADIGNIDMDLKELKTTDDLTPIVQATKAPNANPLIANCTKAVTAVRGTQCGAREISVTSYDFHPVTNAWAAETVYAVDDFVSPTVLNTHRYKCTVAGTSGTTQPVWPTATAATVVDGTVTWTESGLMAFTADPIHPTVAANYLDTYVMHVRTNAEILDATLYAKGGKVGAYGYPFTYVAAYPYSSDQLGHVVLDVSEGAYEVWAEKPGYKKQTAQTVNSLAVTIPATKISGFPDTYVWLGAITIAEARDFTRQSVYASVEGLVYARPKGLAPTACYGLDDRLDSVVTETYNYRRMWYMCDADNAAEGLEFQLRIPGPPSSEFDRQWDDSALVNDDTGNSLYLGKRPDEGDTICVTGWLETRSGYETRLILDDVFLGINNAGKYKYIYYNLTGEGLIPTKPLPTPLSPTVPQISHPDNASYAEMWGQYAEVNATPVSWHADGKNLDGTSVADPNMYLVITDTAGNWSTITFQTLNSLNIPPGTATTPPPVTLGVAYTFRGACGRRSRFGVGTIRPRGPGDIVQTGEAPADPGANSVGVIRGISSGSVAFRGIVTAKFTSYMFVENSDRSVGVKVIATPTWVAVADEVLVVGDLQLLDGMKQVLPSLPIAVLGSGNALPELGMRHRDVGGVDCYNTWTATTGYDVGNLVVPTVWNGSRYACTVAGTSSDTEPTWPAGLSETVVDGTVTWQNVGWDYIANPATDPGVYHGRGPLNVGLLVTVSGLVTYRDDAATPTFFYIWDGSNMCLSGEDPRPLDDGTGYRGLRIDHSGWLTATDPDRGVRAYQDWVTVNGIVVVKMVDVGLETIYIPAVLPKTVTLNTALDFVPITAPEATALTAKYNLFALPNLPAATGPGIVPYATWAASTGYAVGNVVIPTTPNTRRYRCTTAGTSGATQPIWLTGLGKTVVDGTVIWTNVGWDTNGVPSGPLAWECPQVIAPTKDPSEVTGRVYRLEYANKSLYLYDMDAEPNGTFGGMLLGDGYWVLLDNAWAVSYTGLVQHIPQWIATSAPEGWMQMALPQDHNTETNTIQMSDGRVVKSLQDASQWGANWVWSTGFWWNNQDQSGYEIGLPDDSPTTTMQPWRGYQFLVHEPNKAWIIP